jgi:hypothetical protein
VNVHVPQAGNDVSAGRGHLPDPSGQADRAGGSDRFDPGTIDQDVSMGHDRPALEVDHVDVAEQVGTLVVVDGLRGGEPDAGAQPQSHQRREER